MATRNYEGKKFEKGLATKIVDALTIEEALQININNKPFTVTMRTPGNDDSLVRGLLHTEGIISTTFHFPEIMINNLIGDIHCSEAMSPEYKVVAVRIRKIKGKFKQLVNEV